MTAATREAAAELDAKDPLAGFCDRFDLPEGVIYLDGNSLGPPPKTALKRLDEVAQGEWARGLIRSWNDANWIDLPKICGAKIATLIGAHDDEVIVADSVTVNIFKLAAALLAKRPGALAVEQDEFPTDGYILEGLSKLAGAPLIRLASDDRDELADKNISVLIKSLVHYKTAAVADMKAWEQAAAREGVSIIWDLSHAAGVIDISLKAAGARYAVGCGYKFLNGGPGAPAFLYVAKDVADNLDQPLSGWMGHASPFDFSDVYKPAPGVSRFACGTPSILSLAALDAALDLFADIDMAQVEAKAQALGDLFLSRTLPRGLVTTSPPLGERRGGHIGLCFEHGYEVVQALIDRGVIGDFRAPDLMRFGFSPLFLRYVDIWDAADALNDVLQTKSWRKPEYAERKSVT